MGLQIHAYIGFMVSISVWVADMWLQGLSFLRERACVRVRVILGILHVCTQISLNLWRYELDSWPKDKIRVGFCVEIDVIFVFHAKITVNKYYSQSHYY